MEKVKVVLLGMTGFGNNALNILTEKPNIELIGVLTPRKYNTPFPYYECEQLQDIVVKKGVALYEGLMLKDGKTCKLIKSFLPDLIVVSNFNQIIPQDIISIPKLGVINIHPSLLPKYRGATPTVWALLNGEEKTGITIHFIDNEKLDQGRIILQAKLKIEPSDTDGSLRFRLAELSEEVLSDALDLIMTKDKKAFPQQDESRATYYPKRTLKDAEIDLERPFKDILNKIRAMSPYPGARLNYNGEKYIVKNAVFLHKNLSKNIYNGDELIVKTTNGIVKFQIKREN